VTKNSKYHNAYNNITTFSGANSVTILVETSLFDLILIAKIKKIIKKNSMIILSASIFSY